MTGSAADVERPSPLALREGAEKNRKVLKKHRKAKGLSQELLAEKADIHPIYVGMIERSLRNPSLNVAQGIADGLGLSLTQMVAEAEQLQKKRT